MADEGGERSGQVGAPPLPPPPPHGEFPHGNGQDLILMNITLVAYGEETGTRATSSRLGINVKRDTTDGVLKEQGLGGRREGSDLRKDQ